MTRAAQVLGDMQNRELFPESAPSSLGSGWVAALGESFLVQPVGESCGAFLGFAPASGMLSWEAVLWIICSQLTLEKRL